VCGIDHQLVQQPAGFLEFAALQRRQRQHFAGGGAEGAVEQRSQPVFELGLVGLVGAQQTGAQPRHILQQRGNGGVGGERVERLHRAGAVG